MGLKSINPADGSLIKEYEEFSGEKADVRVRMAGDAFEHWKLVDIQDRLEPMRNLAEYFRENKQEMAEVMTKEMGKPIDEAVAEVEKCAWCIDYYVANGPVHLAHEVVETDSEETYIEYAPLGVLLGVMPWNFPYWQVIRFAVPSIIAGNTVVLKHSSNVSGCSVELEKAFKEAGFPDGVFESLLIGSSKVEAIIRHPDVRAVSVTGSEGAGRSVAQIAGSELKKCVLELGGSDPYIVLADADLETALDTAVKARLQNGGQSCIAAKRFIIVEDIYDEFVNGLKERFEALKIGDPMSKDTDIGPMSSKQILEEIKEQVENSVEAGAKLVTGGKVIAGEGYYYTPTILTEVTEDMPVYFEETFGPVATVLKAKDASEAIETANNSALGLGASLWTNDLNKAKKLASIIDSGNVCINGMVKSDPRVPFGGIKNSGYGRELGKQGIHEFVNIKTIRVN